MPGYEGFTEQRVKHLEMIERVISRLGTDSFLIKGWGVTVTGALLGFAVDKQNRDLALLALLPALFFWGLDGQYLRMERLFRHLFEQVRQGSEHVQPFFMAATTPEFEKTLASEQRESWRQTVVRRKTLVAFYGPLAAVAIAVSLLIG